MEKYKKVKLAENLYKLTYFPNFRSNIYLLKGNPTIMIDAGFRTKERPSLVVLTHCHVDHGWSAYFYRKNGAKIGIGRKDASHFEARDGTMQPPSAAKIWGKTKVKIFKPDLLLKENDTIKNTNFTLKVVELPGHTPGSIALWDPEKRILFSGDTWYGGDFVGSSVTGNALQLRRSVARLKRLRPLLICSGHDIKSRFGK